MSVVALRGGAGTRGPRGPRGTRRARRAPARRLRGPARRGRLHVPARAAPLARAGARRAVRAAAARAARRARPAPAAPSPSTTSRCSTATRSAWTSRGACLDHPCRSSSGPLRSSATSYRTPRCATRRSCACSGLCSADSSRSRASTRPPPPPLPPPPPPPPPAPSPRPALTTTTRSAAGGRRSSPAARAGSGRVGSESSEPPRSYF